MRRRIGSRRRSGSVTGASGIVRRHDSRQGTGRKREAVSWRQKSTWGKDEEQQTLPVGGGFRLESSQKRRFRNETGINGETRKKKPRPWPRTGGWPIQ